MVRERLILLVEDNPGDARLIQEMLKWSGEYTYNVTSAVDISGAFACLEKSDFDVVLLDLNLPDSSGLATLDAITLKTTNLIPVIVLTGLSDEETGISAIEHGADDYLVKGQVNSWQITRSIRYSIERKKVGTELRETRELFQLFLDRSPIYVFFKDENIRSLRLSRNYEDMLGKPLDELIGKTMEELFPSEFAKSMVADDKRILESGDEFRIEEELNGHFYNTIKFPIHQNGRPKYLAGYTIDITEQRLMENALRESEERYRTFINATDDMAFLKDENFRYLMVNNRNVGFFGKKPEEIIGKNDFELMEHDLADLCLRSDESAAAKSSVVITEESINKKIYETRKFRVPLKGGKYGIGGFIRDVTDKREAEKVIENAAHEWRTTFDSIDDVIWFLDTDFRIVRANAASKKFLEKSPSELIGKHCWEVVHGTDMPVDWCPVARLKKSFTPETSIMKIKDRWLSIKVYPVINDNSELGGVVHIISDITLQKRSEDELLLRSTAMKNAANAIIITDLEGFIIWSNPAFETLTGYSIDEVIGQNSRDLIRSGVHGSEFYRNLWDTVASGKIWHGEIINRRKDGSHYPEEMTIAPVKNSEGVIINYIAIKQDITERKFASDILNSRLELLNFSENNSLEKLMIKALDDVEKFTGSSISFFHLVDENQNSLMLQAWSTATSEKFCKAEGKGLHYKVSDAGIWADCVRERKTVIHNDYMNHPHRKGLPEGHAAVIRELVVPILRDDQIKGILGIGNKSSEYNERDANVTSYFADIIWDVVERKRKEEYLKDLNEKLEIRVADRTKELEKANRELESFSYSVSHDLRAPLRHITGFIEMLKNEIKDKTDEKTDHYIDVISHSTVRMGQLIEDLLSFSRMKRMVMSRQTVNMDKLVDDILTEFSDEIEKTKIDVKKKSLPETEGDSAMLRIVFVNLISNAVKFTSKTSNPAMIIGSEMIDGENVYFVRDNGAGFDMRYSDKLFGVFQRLHSENEFEGVGIGLAMVRNIVERHEGRIWAESKPGEGTCFFLVLPDKN